MRTRSYACKGKTSLTRSSSDRRYNECWKVVKGVKGVSPFQVANNLKDFGITCYTKLTFVKIVGYNATMGHLEIWYEKDDEEWPITRSILRVQWGIC